MGLLPKHKIEELKREKRKAKAAMIFAKNLYLLVETYKSETTF